MARRFSDSAHAGVGGDVVHADFVVAALMEQVGGRFQDLLAAGGIGGSHSRSEPRRRSFRSASFSLRWSLPQAKACGLRSSNSMTRLHLS